MRFNQLSTMKQLRVAADLSQVKTNPQYIQPMNSPFHPFDTQSPVDETPEVDLSKHGIKSNIGELNSHSPLTIAKDARAPDAPRRRWTPSIAPGHSSFSNSITFNDDGDKTILSFMCDLQDVAIDDGYSLCTGSLSGSMVFGDDPIATINRAIKFLGGFEHTEECIEVLTMLLAGFDKVTKLPEDVLTYIKGYGSLVDTYRALCSLITYRNYDYNDDGELINLPEIIIDSRGPFGFVTTYSHASDQRTGHSLEVSYVETPGAKFGTISASCSFNNDGRSKETLFEEQVSVSLTPSEFVNTIADALDGLDREQELVFHVSTLLEYTVDQLRYSRPFIDKALANGSIVPRNVQWPQRR